MAFISDGFMGLPGLSAAKETQERHFMWGHPILTIMTGAIIDGTARDAGNTNNTSVLRAGLLLGRIASTGELKEYNPVGTDGSNEVAGILAAGFNVVDIAGSNQDKFAPIVVAGPVKASQVLLLDNQARAQMASRFIFDDRNSVPNMLGWRDVVAKADDYTVVNDTDNCILFTSTSADAINFTLPTTIKKGQKFGFFSEGAGAMTITAPADKLVTHNDAAATSIAFSTAGEIIGNYVEIMVNADATKYIALTNLAFETVTSVIA